MSEISALIKESPEKALAPFRPVKTQRGGGYLPGSGSLPDTESPGTLILGPPASSIVRNKCFCLNYPLCGVLVTTAPMD